MLRSATWRVLKHGPWVALDAVGYFPKMPPNRVTSATALIWVNVALIG
jgi:hypothetical protein